MSRPFDQALRDARRDQRYPVSFAADMYVGRARYSVTVRDLSRNGAMLSGADMPPVGSRVLVTLGAAKLFGSVAWVHDVYCGLALLEPIEPLQVVRDMTRGQARREAANQNKL
jgi:hypothetical protein